MIEGPDNPLSDLIRLFARLPGVGERSATRHAFHVLQSNPDFAAAFSASLQTIHDKVKRCERCGNFGSAALCSICSDRNRKRNQICVVARVQDLHALERGGSYRGAYHVLHGLLSPLDGLGPDSLSTEGLLARIQADAVQEVVLATPLSVEGEATALYLAQLLRGCEVAVSRIASGIPHGGELEFADQVTLGRAFEGRRAFV